jgi:hypothetical protein
MTQNGRGRPTLLETHPLKGDAIIENLSVGASRVDSVRAAGVNYQTFLNWIAFGEEAKTKEENGDKLTKRERLYLDFVERVNAAESQCAIDAQMIVYSAMAKGDVQTARWWLESRRPEQFGRENRFAVNARVENTGTVTQNVNHAIDPATAKEVIDILALAGAFDVAAKADFESVDDTPANS